VVVIHIHVSVANVGTTRDHN